MSKIIKTMAVGQYGGHSIKNNKSVDITLKFAYSELPNYIKLIQLLNENIDISVKKQDEKSQMLGQFMLKEIRVDHDGEGIVKFNSMIDFVEADNINSLVGNDLFKVRFTAEIEDVGEGE